MSEYLKSLIGKRVRFQRKGHSSWFIFDSVEGPDGLSGTYEIRYVGKHPDDGCRYCNRMKADGTNEDPDFNLIVHPDDLEETTPVRTRETIQAEIDALQKELEAMPDVFPEEGEYCYIGWNHMGGATALYETPPLCSNWKHISRFRLVEVERIR